jgi:hypothetical protein
VAGKGWFLLDLKEGGSHGSLGITLGHTDNEGYLGNLPGYNGGNDEGTPGTGEGDTEFTVFEELELLVLEILRLVHLHEPFPIDGDLGEINLVCSP